jgi:hypothetical protein
MGEFVLQEFYSQLAGTETNSMNSIKNNKLDKGAEACFLCSIGILRNITWP